MVDKKNGDQKKRGRNKPPTLPVGPINTEGYGSPSGEKRTGDQTQTNDNVSEGAIVRLTRALVWWTGILAVATTGLGVAAFFQWRALESTDHHIGEQLKIMQAGQRAWVNVETVKINSPLVFTEDKARMGIKVGLRNLGNFPAVNVRAIIHIYPGALPIKGAPPECTSTTFRPPGLTLFPSELNDAFPWHADTEAGGLSTPLPKEGFEISVVGCVLYASAGDEQTMRSIMFGGLMLHHGVQKNDPTMTFTREKTFYEVEELTFEFIPGMGGTVD